MADWMREVWDRADALDAQGFAARFAPEGTFHLGNNQPMVGPAEIATRLTEFFGSIRGMRHTFERRYTLGSADIMEGSVRYTRLDGSTVDIPAAAVTESAAGRITSARSYIDLAPLFMPTGGIE